MRLLLGTTKRVCEDCWPLFHVSLVSLSSLRSEKQSSHGIDERSSKMDKIYALFQIETIESECLQPRQLFRP